MASGGGFGHAVVPDIHHPEIMRGVLERVLATGDVLGRDAASRIIVLAVAVEPWLFDELAAFGADLDGLEPEPDDEEDDDPAEDEEA